MKTLSELKMEKAHLRNVMDNQRQILGYIRWHTAQEYGELLQVLRQAESRILKPIVISLLLLILTIVGCISNTLDGMRQDIHNASRPADQAKWSK